MGYTLAANAVLTTPQQKAFLDDISSKLPFDLFVTSATRTAAAQVRAMFTKIELGDNLLNIYKDKSFAQSIIDAYPNEPAAIAIVEEYAAAGGGSTHLRGLGVDFRTRDKSDAQIEQMMKAAKELGTKPLYETTPPHIHVSIPKDYKIAGSPLTANSGLLLLPIIGLGGYFFVRGKR